MGIPTVAQKSQQLFIATAYAAAVYNTFGRICLSVSNVPALI